LRFFAVVSAVFLGNLITLAILGIAFALLISDQGQAFMRSLGYDVSPLASVYYQHRIDKKGQPGISQMKPMTVVRQAPVNMPAQNQDPVKQPKRSSGSTNGGADPTVVKSTLEVCKFWNEEYRKDGSKTSLSHRNSACNRYEKLTGRDIERVIKLAEKPYKTVSQKSGRERRSQEIAEQKREHEVYCGNLKEKIDHYDSRLRAGGDGDYMNYWRGKRREVSKEYSWKCLRNSG